MISDFKKYLIASVTENIRLKLFALILAIALVIIKSRLVPDNQVFNNTEIINTTVNSCSKQS